MNQRPITADVAGLRALLGDLHRLGASDVFISPSLKVRARLNGNLVEVSSFVVSRELCGFFVNEVAGGPRSAGVESGDRFDTDYIISSDGYPLRFRCNVTGVALFTGEAACDLTFRIIPHDVPTIEHVRFSRALFEACISYDSGLVLVVGATDTGKSTTLAAIIREIAETGRARVVSVEDPIEFPLSKFGVQQSGVGVHVRTFADAIRASRRRAPDVNYVGEMRDAESVSAVIGAVQSAQLVFSTLHTASCSGVLERLMREFPVAEQHGVAMNALEALRVVVAQYFERDPRGNRVCIREYCVFTPAIRQEIWEMCRAGEPLERAFRVVVNKSVHSFLDSAAVLVAAGLLDDDGLDRVRLFEAATR